ncbi:hypothetical protein [Acinetobacter sp. HR7]|uniref:hypothetical protein n=1 Tax=Acinetobacter sp. HR7 TaxID=1509403 RepID=UPI000537B061|nr:hypothetical protein [Acinetobacter sp. HR7]KGT47333.1 hypothetical protein GW12_16920 [Acinetobacter sp. HR7]
MKIGLILLMVVFLVILVGLVIMSARMLTKVNKQEKRENAGKIPARQLHPKLQAELEQRNKTKK